MCLDFGRETSKHVVLAYLRKTTILVKPVLACMQNCRLLRLGGVQSWSFNREVFLIRGDQGHKQWQTCWSGAFSEPRLELALQGSRIELSIAKSAPLARQLLV